VSRFFVTGASGFIGRAVVRWLKGRGHDVTCMTRHAAAGDAPVFVSTLEECLSNPSALAERLGTLQPHVIVHLAWGRATNTARDDPYHYLVNLRFTQLLVDLLADGLSGVHVVGIGSQAEHGVLNEVLTPASVCRPADAYGRAKRLAGEYLLARLPESCWLRLLTAYGPGDDENKLIPYVARCYRDGAAPVLSPGEQRWDFIHVDDAAAAIGLAGERRVAGLHMLASGETATIKEVALRMRELAIRRGLAAPEPVLGGRPYRQNELFLLAADASSLRVAASWAPAVPLDAGLESVLA
jgi:UDP-glucose 4-epimerase